MEENIILDSGEKGDAGRQEIHLVVFRQWGICPVQRFKIGKMCKIPKIKAGDRMIYVV